MLSWLWGAVMALALFTVVLWVLVTVSRAMIGNLGTALLIVVIAVSAAVTGWQWLIHNDNVWLQSLGWSVAIGTVLGTLKAAQVGVRALHARTQRTRALKEQ